MSETVSPVTAYINKLGRKEYISTHPKPILVISKTGEILDVNPQTILDYTGIAQDPKILVGSNIADLFSQAANSSLFSLMKATIKASRAVELGKPNSEINYPVA